jgi:aminoglycoside phosphotransferase family enzyme/predicted kinase
MVVDDQHAVLTFLGSPAACSDGGSPVERIDTHASVVFLSGSKALKMKRAVRYDYLDFSTLERRRMCCELELALNRRTAPGLYRGVVAVTRDGDGRLALGGPGLPVEWLVEMARFDQEQLCDRLAARGHLVSAHMTQTSAAVAALHGAAERRPDKGGVAGMRWVADGNRDGLAEYGAGVLPSGDVASLDDLVARAVDAQASLLEARRLGGFVRQCHGDLHLGNIVVLENAPTLFDGVEFNDDISCIDVAYDLAFLVMDLWRLDLHVHAHQLFNQYLQHTRDFGSLPLLPLFLSSRAAVRAKTSATAAALTASPPAAADLRDRARGYLSAALDFLTPRPASLVAIGGFSGTGKSTQGALLAPSVGRAPGALHLRSDVERKALHGVSATTRLHAGAYDTGTSAQVYGLLRDQARRALAAGHAVVVDAVFSDAVERRAIEAVASDAGAPFVGVWLDGPLDALVARVRARGLDASDATEEVVRGQAATGPGPLTWTRLDAGGEADAVHRAIRDAVTRRGARPLR